MSQPPKSTIKQAISRAKKAAKLGDTAVALQLYNSVLQQHPNHIIANKGLRKLQRDSRNNKSNHTKITDPSEYLVNTLINLYQSGQMKKTEQVCRELLQTYPNSLVLIRILAAALQGQGNIQDALANYDRAIQLKHDDAEAYNNRGVAPLYVSIVVASPDLPLTKIKGDWDDR